jgi:adenosine deaminase
MGNKRMNIHKSEPLRTIFANAGLAVLFVLFYVLAVQAQTTRDTKADLDPGLATERYFESIRKSPPQMLAFLRSMPKGADLHSHLSGAIYAESYIQWAAEKGLCVTEVTTVLSTPPCDKASGQIPASSALSNQSLYGKLVDAWSTRNLRYSGTSGYEQFFGSFGRFGPATFGNTGRMLAEVASRAARGRVLYLELMLTPDGRASSLIGQKVGWDGDLTGTVEKLKSNGIDAAVASGLRALRDAEAEKDRVLRCGTAQADPGCGVTIRYIAQVGRAAPLGPVFAQMVTGLALANDPNSKVVAINLVQPEDSLLSMQNFTTHMEMLNFLRPLYPQANITLHAGELAPGLVPPEGLTFHIRESIMKGRAQRIGHGVSVMNEEDPYGLLTEMARRNIMVEICLTSNDTILGIRKEQHPLATYLQYGVPVALGTDDEGVSRSELSREFLKAAEEHGLRYGQLKTMARNSLQYAFLPGVSLWADARRFIPVAQCSKDVPAKSSISNACNQFLAASEKARLQLKLEEEFKAFESQY